MILYSIRFTFLKMEILLALVFFFSTFMSNMLTITVSLMVYFLSHSFGNIIDMAVRSKSIVFENFTRGLQLLFPPFEAMNIKDLIGSFDKFTTQFYLMNSFYAVAYAALIIYLTVLIFNRKKFEI